MNNSSSCLQFHSHFSDNRRQDVSTTNAHMKMIDNLKLNNQDISGCTVWESTDWCSEQYCCSLTLYFLSYVCYKHNLIIYRMIGAPCHGKDIVDGINICDKRYLTGKYV